MFKPLSFAILGLSAVSLVPAVASAATVFTDRTAFLANLQSGSYTETFNSLPISFLSSPRNFSQGGFSYDATAADNFFPAGTAADVWLVTNRAQDSIVFNFTGGNVTAVGGFFFGSDVNGNFASGNIRVTLDDGTTETITNATTTSFLGFTGSVPITSLTVAAIQPPTTPPFLFPTVNDFTVGQQVVTTPTGIPEPSSTAGLVAMPLGIALWSLFRRRAA
jgi:hypothetical protein